MHMHGTLVYYHSTQLGNKNAVLVKFQDKTAIFKDNTDYPSRIIPGFPRGI